MCVGVGALNVFTKVGAEMKEKKKQIVDWRSQV